MDIFTILDNKIHTWLLYILLCNILIILLLICLTKRKENDGGFRFLFFFGVFCCCQSKFNLHQSHHIPIPINEKLHDLFRRIGARENVLLLSSSSENPELPWNWYGGWPFCRIGLAMPMPMPAPFCGSEENRATSSSDNPIPPIWPPS